MNPATNVTLMVIAGGMKIHRDEPNAVTKEEYSDVTYSNNIYYAISDDLNGNSSNIWQKSEVTLPHALWDCKAFIISKIKNPKLVVLGPEILKGSDTGGSHYEFELQKVIGETRYAKLYAGIDKLSQTKFCIFYIFFK